MGKLRMFSKVGGWGTWTPASGELVECEWDSECLVQVGHLSQLWGG